MSIKAMAVVWEHSAQKGSALLLLLYLASCAHDDGSNAYPSVRRMAKFTRLTPRNVQMLLRSLEQSGEIARMTESGPGGTNIYRLNLDQMGEAGFRGEKFSGAKSSVEMGENFSPGGEIQRTGGVKLASPNTLIEPSLNKKEPSVSIDAAAKSPPRSKSTPIPDDFTVTDEMTNWALAKGFDFAFIEEQTERFMNHALATGRIQVDWTRAWRNWLTSPYAKANAPPNGMHRPRTKAQEQEDMLIRIAKEGYRR